MLRRAALAFALLASFASFSFADGGDDRDPELTPGDLCTTADADFDEFRYEERIAHCRRNVSRSDKVRIGASYGLEPAVFSQYQFDHFIPLSLGGSNADENVWPLLVAHARRKAQLEQDLFNRLSQGVLTQAEAIEEIRAWR